MAIHNLFSGKQPVISMEVFPPKPDSSIGVIDNTLDALKDMNPGYISVTYGAGGSNASGNLDIARKIVQQCGCPALGHLTCVGADESMIDSALDAFRQAGVEDVLALRGDVPPGMSEANAFRHYSYASDLVQHIHRRGGFGIAAACYPETHFGSDDMQQDMDMLKLKVDCGVQFLITQLFFDNDSFFSFCERARAAGIAIPIEAGVMPVREASQILRMTTLCGASIPAALSKLIARYGKSPEDFQKAALEYACRQIEGLLKGGAQGIHLYTMNRPKLIRSILEAVL